MTPEELKKLIELMEKYGAYERNRVEVTDGYSRFFTDVSCHDCGGAADMISAARQDLRAMEVRK